MVKSVNDSTSSYRDGMSHADLIYTSMPRDWQGWDFRGIRFIGVTFIFRTNDAETEDRHVELELTGVDWSMSSLTGGSDQMWYFCVIYTSYSSQESDGKN